MRGSALSVVQLGVGRKLTAALLTSPHLRGSNQGAARYVGTGKNRWPLVHVDDLADLYLLALEKAPPGTLLLGVSGPSRPVSEIAAAASRGAGAGGRTLATPLEEARTKLGGYADALALDQQASGRRAQELLGWRPNRPDVLEDIERGSYPRQDKPVRV